MDVRRELERLVRSALDDDPRVALIAVRRLAEDELPWLEQRAVRMARQRGWSWSPIARLLQISRQAARRRHVQLDTAAPRRRSRPLSPGEVVDRELTEIARNRRHEDELRAWEESGIDIVPW